MKYYSAILAAGLILAQIAATSQVPVVHVATLKSSLLNKVVEINSLPVVNGDLYKKAVYNQLGMIGNDFNGIESIGTESAEGGVDEIWQPLILSNGIEGHKRTVCGNLQEFYRRTPTRVGSTIFGEDDDYNFYINPQFSSKQYLELAKTKYALNPHASDRIGAEIDIKFTHWKLLKKYANLPNPNIDCICAYGPFVYDQPNEDDHQYFEIHPAEQIWWTQKYQNGFTGVTNSICYNFLQYQDNSGRFNIWEKNPSTGTFAIPFELTNRKKPVRFLVETLNKSGLLDAQENYSHYYLVNNGDTLVDVSVPNSQHFYTISFEKVGIYKPDAYRQFITGFVAFKIKLDAVRDQHEDPFSIPGITFKGSGFVHCRIWKENLQYDGIPVGIPVSFPGVSVQPQRFLVEVKLDSMKCLYSNDYGLFSNDDVSEVYGYAGIKIDSKTYPYPIGSSFMSNQGKDGLLWSALDDIGESIHFTKGMVKRFDEGRTYILGPNDEIHLNGEMKEDDESKDGNPTDSDGDGYGYDDIDDAMGRILYPPVIVRNLIMNQSNKFQIEFKSTETRVVCYYSIWKKAI